MATRRSSRGSSAGRGKHDPSRLSTGQLETVLRQIQRIAFPRSGRPNPFKVGMDEAVQRDAEAFDAITNVLKKAGLAPTR
jgi:hypothetical protein